MRCLDPQTIEGLVKRTLPGRRTNAALQHLASCQSCADAVAAARANESWLIELQESAELTTLRERIKANSAPRAAETPGLTGTHGTR